MSILCTFEAMAEISSSMSISERGMEGGPGGLRPLGIGPGDMETGPDGVCEGVEAVPGVGLGPGAAGIGPRSLRPGTGMPGR